MFRWLGVEVYHSLGQNIGFALLFNIASVWHYAFRITYEDGRWRILPAITFKINTPDVVGFFVLCWTSPIMKEYHKKTGRKEKMTKKIWLLLDVSWILQIDIYINTS